MRLQHAGKSPPSSPTKEVQQGMIPWLDPLATPAFPPAEAALTAAQGANGLLAGGGALNAQWLLAAYQRGIFPWFNDDQPILWWTPDPRLILRPRGFKCARSLRQTLRRADFNIRFDSAFDAVVAACAAPRPDQPETWIHADMAAAYGELHRLGHAHSVEVWQQEELIGGLYGIALGKIFFGESMFSRRRDASKVALAHLAALLAGRGFALIDCQVRSEHLVSLGAEEVTRAHFNAELARFIPQHIAPAAQPWRDEKVPDLSALAAGEKYPFAASAQP